MDKRTLLALVLTAIVIVVTPIIFPSRRAPVVDSLPLTSRDSMALDSARARTVLPPAAVAGTEATPNRTSQRAPSRPTPRPVVVDTTTIRTLHASFAIASPGGTPVAVTLPEYRALHPGASEEQPVHLLIEGDRLVHLRLVGTRDTIALDTVAFRAAPASQQDSAIVQTFTSTSSSIPVTLTYRFPLDSFVVHLSGSVGGAGAAQPWNVLLQLPTRLRSEEADVREDERSLAVAYRKRVGDVESTWFRDLDTAVARADTGGIRWITERNKYFVVAAIPNAPDSAFTAIRMLALRGEKPDADYTSAHTTALLSAPSGEFGLTLYAGPQAFEHLRATAPDLENVNPYGGFLSGVVQPFASIIMQVLLWMRHTFNVSYGWVVVIFGVAVRILLWPLNQNAMRSSLKMQRIQPQLAELQKKYRDNPEKQRDAMMKLYQEHGMSPFTPLLGCLPMLLPMPILYALYFVFRSTIELRGVSFLWMPDLSLADPLYITPLVMGISMFLMSWIGMRGVPPSPQSKMMSYVMPVMFTALFWKFASGLNLYYAVQNIAALPQQWLISRERAANASGASAPPSTRKSGGGGGGGGGKGST